MQLVLMDDYASTSRHSTRFNATSLEPTQGRAGGSYNGALSLIMGTEHVPGHNYSPEESKLLSNYHQMLAGDPLG